MNEKSILSLLVGPGIFSNKELKEVASKTFNQKFLKEFDELNIKLPDDTRDDGRATDDAADDASPISIDDEEERKIMADQSRLKEKYKGFSLDQGPSKNLFQKSRLDDVKWDDFEDEEEDSRSTIPRQPALMMPKLKEFKPNPWEKLAPEQILDVVGTEKGQNVYGLTDMYLPTTRELRGNVFKYLYKNLIRNPKDILKLHRRRHEEAFVFEKEILRIFKLMYGQKFSMKQETAVAKPPEASVSILKDTVKNPTTYSHDPIFSPLNSTDWFDSLQHDLMKGIDVENQMETEKEAHSEPKHDDNGPAVHYTEPINGLGARDGKLIPMEASSRRVGNATTTNAGAKTDKYNFQKALSSLFESTPNRENGEESVRSEDRSVENSYANGSPRYENESGTRGMYNRALNQNMREYLNDHYEDDRKALFSFYTGLRGHDKNETALWGETQKEEISSFDMMGATSTRGNINYNYMVVPFKNDRERAIFKYQTDLQDESEIDLSLLYKKRRLTKDRDVKLKVTSYDNMYFNKNVLEASWNDFFFKNRAPMAKEKEYSLILIDLNDKSVFYDKIHPIVFGVQKATKKALAAFDNLPDEANPMEEPQLEDHRDIPESAEIPGFSMADAPPKFAGPGTQHAPSETDSMSIAKKPDANKREKERLKNLRITAVKKGYDPDKLTKENAYILLDKPGKSESKAGAVSLPPILRLVKDLTRKISTSAVIQHSKVAEEFQFNEFHIKKQDYEYFHRPDMRKLLEKDKSYHPWRVEIVQQEEEKKDPESVLDDPFGVNELVDSFEYFKNHKRLSLREGKFALFEYIEENPLIISNIGMASRLNRYVYPYRAYSNVKTTMAQKGISNENEELIEFVRLIKETFGQNGSITFLDDKQSLPLIGQLTNDKYLGVTVFDNNLFYAPIFIHKAPETDFVLVRYQSSDGSKRYYLRKIDYIYTVGQIEPKVEVFNPSCRGLTSFIRKSIKHTIKKKFANSESVHMEEMKQLFPTVNDHNMKKYIQFFGGDPDPDDNKRFFYNKDLDHEQNDDDPERNEGNITPEEVCQYERMHASNVRLKNVGLEDLRSCDKINTIRNRYMKRNNIKIWDESYDPNEKRNLAKMNIVANYCSEELQLTAWNLSQSFLSSKQKQGRLYLTGFGDPTGGHGGYSYVKLPLKTSRYEKEEKKNNALKASQVTGTNADLRKLPIKHVDRMITMYGDYKEEHISKLTRWDKIDLLRQIANEHPENEELAKYARAFRLTTKMQREKYQKDINTLFMTIIDNLAKRGSEEISSDDEVEFECGVEQLIDRELEESMKKMPKDQGDQLSRMEDDDKDDDDDEQDDGIEL